MDSRHGNGHLPPCTHGFPSREWASAPLHTWIPVTGMGICPSAHIDLREGTARLLATPDPLSLANPWKVISLCSSIPWLELASVQPLSVAREGRSFLVCILIVPRLLLLFLVLNAHLIVHIVQVVKVFHALLDLVLLLNLFDYLHRLNHLRLIMVFFRL